MQEKGNILDILRKTKSAVKENDIITLKELSNRTVHTSSIYQDSDNIAIAVIVYSLSKILEREKFHEYPQWKIFFKNFLINIDKAISSLERENLTEFTNSLIKIRESIDKLSGNLKNYIQDVFRRASINKASRIYEHGISMEQTANLLGISVFDLAEYAGGTGIGDVDLSVTKDIKERIKIAMNAFQK
ncbi:hypothetical protein HZA33_05440 [Candidatus Pacearchaeota archaeon]|nr:hypothetical protein [Candidatus Pacearchaeota archaeon]